MNAAVHALNRMLGLRCPNSVRIAWMQAGLGPLRASHRSMRHGLARDEAAPGQQVALLTDAHLGPVAFFNDRYLTILVE